MPRRNLRDSLAAKALVAFALLLSPANTHAQDKPSAGAGMGGGMGTGTGAGGPRTEVPPAPPNPDGPFRAGDVTKRAVISARPAATLTEAARVNGVEGTVRLRAVLSLTGKVVNITVVKGLPDGLTEKAIEAARQIRFTPAQKDGRPVSQWVVIDYEFYVGLDDEDADQQAVILERPAAEYTEEARGRKVEGRVLLKVTLLKDGTVGAVRALERLPHGLTESAIEAARKIKFTPAQDKGLPVSVSKMIEYVFKLD
jgi:TonB family protein